MKDKFTRRYSSETMIPYLIDIRTGPNKKNEFTPRSSPLDDIMNEGLLKNSKFIGLYHLMLTVLVVYIINSCIIRQLEEGDIFNWELYYECKNNVEKLLFIWIIDVLYTLWGFIMQKLVLKTNLNLTLARIITYTGEIGIFFPAIYTRLYLNWTPTHYVFNSIQAFIYYFKMHSYSATNFYYRGQYLAKLNSKDNKTPEAPKAHKESISQDENTIPEEETIYPENLTFARFFYLHRAPTLVYQPSYPRNKTVRWDYALYKLILFVFCIIFQYSMLSSFWVPIMRQFVFNEGVSGVGEFYLRICSSFAGCTFICFLGTFEYICNVYAEISTFADRQFYQGAPNNTCANELKGYWQILYSIRPTYMVLLSWPYRIYLSKGYMNCQKVVYLLIMRDYKLSPLKGYIATVWYSALGHELLMFMILGYWRPYMIHMMSSQVGFVLISPLLKNSKLGNYMFWCAMLFGQAYNFFPYIVEKLDITK